MPESVSAALSVDGIEWLLVGVILAGIVRGFTGFGTSMVFLPFAGQVLSPFAALTTLVAIDMIGPWPNVPRALKFADIGDLARLASGLFVAVPVGVWMLTWFAPEFFRWAVSILALGLLSLLVMGFRYGGRLTTPMIFGTGLLSGFLGGIAGLAGPPVIMFYMASTKAAAVIRANLLLFLICADLSILLVLGVGGLLEPSAIVLGLVLAVPYTLANMLGGRLFQPRHERLFRGVSYAIIAGSAVFGMPVWG